MQTARYVQRNIKFATVTNIVPDDEGRYYGFARLLDGDVETEVVVYFHMGDFHPIISSNAGPRFANGRNSRDRHIPPKYGDRIVFLVIPPKRDGQRPKACPWGHAEDWMRASNRAKTPA